MYGRSPVSVQKFFVLKGPGEKIGRVVRLKKGDGTKFQLTTEEMTLQVLGVQVRLVAVRAREFAIGILLRDLALTVPSTRGCSGGASWGAGENTATALGTDHMGRLLTLGEHLLLGHQGALCVRRVHTLLLAHDASGGHGSKNGGYTTAGGRGRGDSLGVRRRGSGLRKHPR